MSWIASRSCDAANCSTTYRSNPSAKFFHFPKGYKSSEEQEKRSKVWAYVVGGLQQPERKSKFLCEYHFPSHQFKDCSRTSLVVRALPAFPAGPVNPITNDYCPIGEESRSTLPNETWCRNRCCVALCTESLANNATLFPLPVHDDTAFAIWTSRIGIDSDSYSEDFYILKYRVCKKHFTDDCFVKDEENDRFHLKNDALPTLYLPNYTRHDNTKPGDGICNPSGMISNASEVEIGDHEVVMVEFKRGISKDNRLTKKFKDNSDNQSSNVLVLHSLENVCQNTIGGNSINANSYHDGSFNYLSQNEKNNIEVGQSRTHNEVCNSKRRKYRNFNYARRRSRGQIGKIRYWSPSDFIEPEVNNETVTQWNPGNNPHPPSQMEFIQQTDSGWDNHVEIRDVNYMLDSQEILPRLENEPCALNNFTDERLDTSGFKCKISRQSKKVVRTKKKKKRESPNDFVFDDNYVSNAECEQDGFQPSQSVLDTSPKKPQDSLEAALLKIFNSCCSVDNAFSCFTEPAPQPDDQVDSDSYSSAASLKIIKSAAKLCEFSKIKTKELQNLISKREEDTKELESILTDHLSTVICITGIDFLKKCFDKVIQEAVEKKKLKNISAKLPSDIMPNENVSDDMKKLAVALQCYSGKAYHTMTQIFDLPFPRTAREWATHADGNPGFSESSFNLIKNEIKKVGRNSIIVSLGVEEVPLRRDISWNGKRLFGYVDLGYGAIDNDYVYEASRAIVFYATAMNRRWELPLGYCLVDNLTPQVRANMINQYIIKLDTVGVRCMALVSNASLLTYEIFQELGVIPIKEYTTCGYFTHPVNRGERVYCFVDIFQLMKSVSNLLADKNTFQYKDNNIEWSHVERINELLNSKNSANDSCFKTDVNSKSFVKDKCKEIILQDCELKRDAHETIRFIEKMDDLKRIFTSCNLFGEEQRQAVTKQNLNLLLPRLNSLLNYFINITHSNGTKIVNSERKLPFILLCITICSLKGMLKKIFSIQKFHVLSIFTDSINLGNVRRMLTQFARDGNQVQTAVEFKNAFHDFVRNKNLLPSDSISYKCSLNMDLKGIEENCLPFNYLYFYEFTPLSSICETTREFLTKTVIEQWLNLTNCRDCYQLVLKDRNEFENCKTTINIVNDIHKMFKNVETVLSEYREIPSNAVPHLFDKISNTILNSMSTIEGFKRCDHLFNSVKFGDICHFTVMIKEMVRIFVKLRLHLMGRQEKIIISPPRAISF